MCWSSFCTHHLCKPCWLLIVSTPVRPIAKELIWITFIFVPVEENHTSSHCISFLIKDMGFFSFPSGNTVVGSLTCRHAVCRYFWLHPLANLSAACLSLHYQGTKLLQGNDKELSKVRIHSKLTFLKIKTGGAWYKGQQGGWTELLVSFAWIRRVLKASGGWNPLHSLGDCPGNSIEHPQILLPLAPKPLTYTKASPSKYQVSDTINQGIILFQTWPTLWKSQEN